MRGLIREREPESIYLEFKKKKDSRGPDLDAADSRQYSRALSGFANSDGGVLVWGVGTDSEERAASLHPIGEVRQFAARLRKSILHATQPVVDGVLVEDIPAEENSAAGYVKCLIPSSDKTPHRAMLAGREYYKRSTEGFYRLEHFDLEDMFGRRPIPRLELQLRIVERGAVGGGGQTQFKGLAVPTIVNSGRGSARAPYVALTVNGVYPFARFGIDGNGSEGLPRRATTDHKRLIFTSSDVIIHPGLSHEVTGIEVFVHANHQERITIPPELVVSYELSAENARLVVGELRASGKEIATQILPERLRDQAF